MNVADLKLSMERYLAVRDALGFTNRIEKVLLPDFVKFVEEHSVSGPIRAELAVEWACASASRHETSGQVRRLSIVRGFLSHLRATVPETEVPAFGLIAGARRPQPYLFTQAQLDVLLQAASRLGPRGSLRADTYGTLIGLLASTGLRIGEAIRLTIGDVQLDIDPPRLQIRETKFNKSRIVPIHPTTAAALNHYAEQRHRFGYDGLSDAFFVSEQGTYLVRDLVGAAFRRMTRQLGMWPSDGRRGPTLHSLRHGFAIRRLVTWYRAKTDVNALTPNLSIYLGHVSPQESYWYLTATPELLSAAADRFECYANGRTK